MKQALRFFIVSVTCLGLLGLASCGDPEMNKLKKDLKNPDVNVRLSAASQLGGMEDEASTVIPMLMDSLNDENEEVRKMVIDALILLGSDSKNILPKLKEIAAKDKNPSVRSGALEAMVKLSSTDPETLATLRGALKDTDVIVAKTAALRLLNQKDQAVPDVADIADVLKRLIQYETEKKAMGESMSIAWGLGELGNKASAALPALEAIAKDTGIMPQTKTMVTNAINAIKGQGQGGMQIPQMAPPPMGN